MNYQLLILLLSIIALLGIIVTLIRETCRRSRVIQRDEFIALRAASLDCVPEAEANSRALELISEIFSLTETLQDGRRIPKSYWAMSEIFARLKIIQQLLPTDPKICDLLNGGDDSPQCRGDGLIGFMNYCQTRRLCLPLLEKYYKPSGDSHITLAVLMALLLSVVVDLIIVASSPWGMFEAIMMVTPGVLLISLGMLRPNLKSFRSLPRDNAGVVRGTGKFFGLATCFTGILAWNFLEQALHEGSKVWHVTTRWSDGSVTHHKEGNGQGCLIVLAIGVIIIVFIVAILYALLRIAIILIGGLMLAIALYYTIENYFLNGRSFDEEVKTSKFIAAAAALLLAGLFITYTAPYVKSLREALPQSENRSDAVPAAPAPIAGEASAPAASDKPVKKETQSPSAHKNNLPARMEAVDMPQGKSSPGNKVVRQSAVADRGRSTGEANSLAPKKTLSGDELFNLAIHKYFLTDASKAFEHFKLAAESGHLRACGMLGRCYSEGRGVAQNFTEAFSWFKKAAERGHPEAQRDLADCYVEGRGTAAAPQAAAFWYEKSARQGFVDAQYKLAQCHEQGTGVPRNPEQARHWYRLAHRNGSALAGTALERLAAAEKAEQERKAAAEKKARQERIEAARQEVDRIIRMAPPRIAVLDFSIDPTLLQNGGHGTALVLQVTRIQGGRNPLGRVIDAVGKATAQQRVVASNFSAPLRPLANSLRIGGDVYHRNAWALREKVVASELGLPQGEFRKDREQQIRAEIMRWSHDPDRLESEVAQLKKTIAERNLCTHTLSGTVSSYREFHRMKQQNANLIQFVIETEMTVDWVLTDLRSGRRESFSCNSTTRTPGTLNVAGHLRTTSDLQFNRNIVSSFAGADVAAAVRKHLKTSTRF